MSCQVEEDQVDFLPKVGFFSKAYPIVTFITADLDTTLESLLL